MWRCTQLGKVVVTCAWPYINYTPHLGTMIGSILSADVVARYYRLRGDHVIFVSGSDEHGTPVEVEAVRLGISPKEITGRNHAQAVELWKKWKISFDNYSRTESPVHKAFVKEIFSKIYENGYIFPQETELPYCTKCERFLPDRFVEGKCPFCDNESARGDQCDSCGRLLEPTTLSEPRCAICGSKPVIRKVKHWYFDLRKFSAELLRFIEQNKNLPANAKKFSLNLIKDGLKPRAITRDNKWGIPAPFPGAEGKTIYVWVEAVLGYVSASIEYFKHRGEEERWKEFWFDKTAKTFYFIGKDNIPFHTLILPALLLATGEAYNLPWNVSSTEFLQFKGERFSKSHKVGIWIDEALELFSADYWRYFLISTRPETKDTNFSWEIFLEKVNADLNDTLGNFVHRSLTFVTQYFNGVVPRALNLDEYDELVLASVSDCVSKAAGDLEACRLQAALRHVIEVSRLGNKYLNEREPWKLIKTDGQKAANTLNVALQLVKTLAVILAPFTPSCAENLSLLLNLHEKAHWDTATQPLPEGHKIEKPKQLFKKVELNAEELQDKLEEIRNAETVTFNEFSKIDLKIGKIVEAENVSGSKNLLKLRIDVGHGIVRQAVAGIAQQYKPEQLEGQEIAVLTNLQPKRIFGLESQVMILAAEDGGIISILQPDKPVKPGSKVK
ncbi:MAG: methionine--tRNA ligase [Candidatus Bathyarchaeota archaeon]|nr:MAG: methionine--tRNA ligase [Candidatus Bathyarchaeota archaeon]